MISQRNGKFLTIFFVVIVVGLVTLNMVRMEKRTSVSSASFYEIPKLELENTIDLAQRGDCQAAERLAGYHMNVSLNFDSALNWARVAARCSEVRPKQTLLVLLLQMDQTPAVTQEVDTLIDQIASIDNEAANRVHEWVKERRQWLLQHANG